MIRHDMPAAEYHAHPAIGSSLLKHILTTPADFIAAYEDNGSEETAAMRKGTAVHSMILEPDTFDSLYALQPAYWGNRAQGEGKKKWDAFKKDNEGKTCIGWDDSRYLLQVRQAVGAHALCKELLKGGHAELSGFATLLNDIEAKARPDLISGGRIWDLKTTSESLDDASIAKTIIASKYHFQATHYQRVFEKLGVPLWGAGWIFISTKTPAVQIRVFTAPDELLTWGQETHDYALGLYKSCRDANAWPGYPEQATDIVIPQWARDIREQNNLWRSV